MARKPKMTVGIISALFIIMHWFSSASAASETLIGSRESCSNEGGQVSVDSIKDMRCFTCMCKNGFVECQRERCPSQQGCFMLLEQERDQCCQLCKGCIWEGVERSSGAEWRDPEDLCRVYKCLAGVVTETRVTCHTPCHSPQPPRPGECCPSCRGCLINGQEVGPERDATIPEDPCLNCHCHEISVNGSVQRSMTCTKVACPVLQCPTWKQVTPTGQCCPICKGSRLLRAPPRNMCFLVSELKSEGEVFSQSVSNPSYVSPSVTTTLAPHLPFMPEKSSIPLLSGQGTLIGKKPSSDDAGTLPGNCTKCTCGRNATVHCVKEACPVLECPVERRVWPIILDPKSGSKRRSCCMKCIQEQAEARRQCTHSGKVYKEGERWALDACRSCICSSGAVRCAMEMCPSMINTVVMNSKGQQVVTSGRAATPNVACPPNTRLYHPKGTCCPTCVESDGVCSVFGDPHYRTFDGRFYSFQGACKYLLASDQCDGTAHNITGASHLGTFSIRVTNDARGTFTSSWTKTISIKVYGHKVSLGQKMRVKLNGRRVALPLSLTANSTQLISVKKEGSGVALWLGLGIMVIWDGNSFLEVSVPTAYKNKLCGLCGNYNDDPKDDLIPRDGATNVAKVNEKMGNRKFGNVAPNQARAMNPSNVAIFASSWRVGGKKACSRKSDSDLRWMPPLMWSVTQSCRGGTNQRGTSVIERRRNRYREQFRKCRALRSNLFSACHDKVNPTMYMRSCLSDLCECPKGGRCHCSSLKAYAHACRRALQSALPAESHEDGSPFSLPKEIESWRNSTGCLDNEVAAASSSSSSASEDSMSEEEMERLERRNRRRRRRRRRKKLMMMRQRERRNRG